VNQLGQVASKDRGSSLGTPKPFCSSPASSKHEQWLGSKKQPKSVCFHKEKYFCKGSL